MVSVATLRVAPVKGLATVLVDRLHLGLHGADEDRRLFLVDDDDAVVTLRGNPDLVRAAPHLDLDRGILLVDVPGRGCARSALADVGATVRTSLFGKERRGRVLGGGVGEALSDLAGKRVRLVLAEGVGVGWDEGPVSIIGGGSIAAVGGPDGDAARYRMLVEVEGTEAYEEDGWVDREVALGEALVRVTQPLGRCAVVRVSPRTGERDWDGLAAIGAARGGDLCLGVIAEVVEPGPVTVRDEVRVLERV